MRIKDCVFCELIEEKWKQASGHTDAKFWEVEGTTCMSLTPLNPVTPGHILMMPVEHVSDAATWTTMTGKVFSAAARLANRNHIESYNLITSVGEPATQSIFHLHVHIVPRVAGDGLHLPWTGQAKQ